MVVAVELNLTALSRKGNNRRNYFTYEMHSATKYRSAFEINEPGKNGKWQKKL